MPSPIFSFRVEAADFVAGRQLPWEPGAAADLLVLATGQVYQQRDIDWRLVSDRRLLLLVPDDIPLGSLLDVYWSGLSTFVPPDGSGGDGSAPGRYLTTNWRISPYQQSRHDGIRLRFDVIEAYYLPLRIFAYRARGLNPVSGVSAGYFSHVCSPSDLEEFPADEPRIADSPQWFRLPYVDLVFRSRRELDDTLRALLQDVRRLKTTLDTLDRLEPGGQETIGDLPDDGSSGSSSG